MTLIELLRRVSAAVSSLDYEDLRLPVVMDGKEIDVFVALVISSKGKYIELTKRE